MKKQRNVTYYQERKESVEADPEIAQMFDL